MMSLTSRFFWIRYSPLKSASPTPSRLPRRPYKCVVTVVGVRNGAEIERAIAAAAGEPNGSLIVLASGVTNAHRRQVIELAAQHRLPAVYDFRYFAAEGGLAAYGHDPADQYRQAAVYIDRILRGAKTSELPVQNPTKFELVINLKTAKALGLTISESFLLRADEVIE